MAGSEDVAGGAVQRPTLPGGGGARGAAGGPRGASRRPPLRVRGGSPVVPPSHGVRWRAASPDVVAVPLTNSCTLIGTVRPRLATNVEVVPATGSSQTAEA